MQTFSEKLRKAREQAGLSQAELARRSGLSRAAISRYESGERSIVSYDTFHALAQALGVDTIELYEDDVQIYETKEEANKAEALSKKENKLIDSFRRLNATGQTEAVNRVEEMTHVPKYTEGGEDHGSET